MQQGDTQQIWNNNHNM